MVNLHFHPKEKAKTLKHSNHDMGGSIGKFDKLQSKAPLINVQFQSSKSVWTENFVEIFTIFFFLDRWVQVKVDDNMTPM